MSKSKAILKVVQGTVSGVGLIGTLTGHGLASIAAQAVGYRIPPAQLKILAKYQYESAVKAFKEAANEWGRT